MEQQERLNVDEEGTALAAKEEVLAPEKQYCIHNQDAGDHKCYEACTGQGRFKMKGLTSAGQCPSTYNEVDSRKEDKVCNDGVTSVKYCSGGSLRVIRVVERTRGEARGLLPLGNTVGTTQCTSDKDCPSTYCQ